MTMQCCPSRRTITIGQDEYDRLRDAEIRLRAMESMPREWNPVREVEQQPTAQARRDWPSHPPSRPPSIPVPRVTQQPPAQTQRITSTPPNWDRHLARQKELIYRRDLIAQGIDPDRRPRCTSSKPPNRPPQLLPTR